MKRRDFIKMGSFITVSVAALGVTACGTSDAIDTGDTDFTSPNPVRPMPAAATGTDWKFPQSIASGDPKSDSIMLWTRVVHSGFEIKDSSASTAIKLRVTAVDKSAALSTNADITTGLTLPGDLVAEVTVPAYGDFDGTVRHKLTGLDDDQVYFYQFIAGDVRSNIGRFKTAPAAASTADVKFAFMSCQDWSANHWGAFSQIVADDIAFPTAPDPSLDFIVHLGDYIYETSSDETGEALHAPLTLPSAGAFAANTADYRFLYKTFRSDPRLQRMHERFPMIAVWDDHEFSDDCWGDHETYSNANAEQKNRRRNANQAWFEYTPADIVFSETATSFQNIKIYRDLKFGQTVHLVMTDERLYRADHVIPETTVNNGAELGRINSRYLAPETSFKALEGLKSPDGLSGIGDNMAQVTMLGATQRDWWKTTMADSTAKWKVWGNEVSLLRMGLHGTNAVSSLIALSIAGVPAQVSSALATMLVPASLGLPTTATPSWVTVIAGLAPSVGPLLAGHGVPPASAGDAAKALLAQTAGAIAAQAANGDAAMLTAAKNSLLAGVPASGIPGLSSVEADSVAPSALGLFKNTNSLVLATTVTAQVSALITASGGVLSTTDAQSIAGNAAYALMATYISAPATSPADLVTAAANALTSALTTAGLGSVDPTSAATAAVGGFRNAIAVGDITIATAVTGAVVSGANSTTAALAAFAITATDAAAPSNETALTTAATTVGLSADQAKAAVTGFIGAKAAGLTTQQQIRAHIISNKSSSVFYKTAAGANATKLSAFLQKFLINADQWDGYSKERGQLMQHLLDEGIENVVAITGDIHAFFAGEVYNNFPGQVTAATLTGVELGSVGAPGDTTDSRVAMVDLVTAGISSTSWFNYLKDAVDGLDPTNALIGKLVYVPIDLSATFSQPANTFVVYLNLLDYSMGKAAPASTTELAAQLNAQIKNILTQVYMANGITNQAQIEALLNGAQSTPVPSALVVQAGIAAKPEFQSAFGLAKTLAASVAANPWLKHVDTEAQGYAVVTATSSDLSCAFKKLSPLVGTTAPIGVVTSTKTAKIIAGTPAIDSIT